MNLYNMGFACGLFAMMIVPILTAFGDKPDSVLYWATHYNGVFIIVMGVLCTSMILMGFYGTGVPPWAVWAGYRRLLPTTGRAPSDYLRMFGAGPVLINIGVNGILGIVYILIVGGELNGPTVGGIFTIMGFSAFGKHAFNIIPVMIGVALGAYGMHYTPDYPALQLAGLFGTTLAPIAGHFGWLPGILAGFIHSALVLQTGGPVAGLNLYNNGFSGGLIAIVLYPTITAIWKRRRPVLRDEDYYDLFEENDPIDISSWRTHARKVPDAPLTKCTRFTPEIPACRRMNRKRASSPDPVFRYLTAKEHSHETHDRIRSPRFRLLLPPSAGGFPPGGRAAPCSAGRPAVPRSPQPASPGIRSPRCDCHAQRSRRQAAVRAGQLRRGCGPDGPPVPHPGGILLFGPGGRHHLRRPRPPDRSRRSPAPSARRLPPCAATFTSPSAGTAAHIPISIPALSPFPRRIPPTAS
jgi:hypothetical protein